MNPGYHEITVEGHRVTVHEDWVGRNDLWFNVEFYHAPPAPPTGRVRASISSVAHWGSDIGVNYHMPRPARLKLVDNEIVAELGQALTQADVHAVRFRGKDLAECRRWP